MAFLADLDPVAKTRFAADPEDETNWDPEILIMAQDVGELGPAERCGWVWATCDLPVGWEGKRSWEDAALASPVDLSVA